MVWVVVVHIQWYVILLHLHLHAWSNMCHMDEDIVAVILPRISGRILGVCWYPIIITSRLSISWSTGGWGICLGILHVAVLPVVFFILFTLTYDCQKFCNGSVQVIGQWTTIARYSGWNPLKKVSFICRSRSPFLNM